MSHPVNRLSGEQKAFFEQKAIQSGKVDTYNNFFSRFFAKHFGLSVKVRTDDKAYHVNRKKFEKWCQSNNVNENFSNLKSLNPVAVSYVLRAYEANLSKIKTNLSNTQNEIIRSKINEFCNLPGSYKCEDYQAGRLRNDALKNYGYAFRTNTEELWLVLEDGKLINFDMKVSRDRNSLILSVKEHGFANSINIFEFQMINSLFNSDSFLVDFQEALSNKDAQDVIEFIREEVKKAITPS